MEKYGYMYDKLVSDIEQFTSPSTTLKTTENPYSMIGFAILLFILLIWILIKT